jgi:hypothetical protein
MEEIYVTNFVSDGTPIPIWEVADITGLTVEELKKTAELMIVKTEVDGNTEQENKFND